nr:hypothetical protein [Tanacetum cinerariifolium]
METTNGHTAYLPDPKKRIPGEHRRQAAAGSGEHQRRAAGSGEYQRRAAAGAGENRQRAAVGSDGRKI